MSSGESWTWPFLLPRARQRAGGARRWTWSLAVGAGWNAPFDAAEVVEATARGGTLIQASAFNRCCAVYAPRYRQASGKAFVERSAAGSASKEVAYQDVARAFREFLTRTESSRPFVLAGHSQGTVLATRLLREVIAPAPLRSRLVVAYLVGGPVTPASLGEGMPVCKSAEEVGCAVGWNARGPAYRRNGFAFVEPMEGRICVSPLSWTATGGDDSDLNRGAVFFDSETPQQLAGFADGRCDNGALMVTQLGAAPRDFMSRILDWSMGPENYHPIEYQMFYTNIRDNAERRVDAYFKRREAR